MQIHLGAVMDSEVVWVERGEGMVGLGGLVDNNVSEGNTSGNMDALGLGGAGLLGEPW